MPKDKKIESEIVTDDLVEEQALESETENEVVEEKPIPAPKKKRVWPIVAGIVAALVVVSVGTGFLIKKRRGSEGGPGAIGKPSRPG